MTNIQPNNETPEPMKKEPITPSSADEKSAGGRTPQTGPGRTQSDDDMNDKQRSGGDVQRDEADEEDAGDRRGGQRTQQETDEGGRSRQGGRSRNM